MKQECEYLNTSVWYKEKITDPYQTFAEFFSAADLVSHKKTVKEALDAASSSRIYDKRNPGDLLYSLGLLESVINSSYLLNMEKKKSPLSIEANDVFDPNLFRGWLGGNLTDWDYFPRMLSLKEFKNPYIVFKRFFRFQDLSAWKTDLRTIAEYALVKTCLSEACIDLDTLSIYCYLTKLIEAAHLIDVRETNHIGGIVKNRLRERSRY
jgi:hypothetical protein